MGGHAQAAELVRTSRRQTVDEVKRGATMAHAPLAVGLLGALPIGAAAQMAPRASSIVHLQRTVGNAAVAQILGLPGHSVVRNPAASLTGVQPVQRCGPVACNCSPEERSQTEGTADTLSVPVVHRSSVLVLQRHPGFRTKKTLETEVLATPELQTAASSADLALEVGKSSGDAVDRLQRALSAAGHPVPITSTYDAATQQAVASFQSEHGIPFPTGRQSGPKTLSTLDDHLLGKPTPKPSPKPAPDKKCNQYEPNERADSVRTKGRSSRTGALGQELRLFNFGAAQGRMKPEHEAAVNQLIKDFGLFDPDSQFEVEFVRGFTDAVDAEELNVLLREQRAIDVQFFMRSNGVPGTPDGQPAADGSFDAGCDPSGRTFARAVFIRLKKKPKKPKPPDPPNKPPDTPQQACGKSFQKWTLQGVGQAGPPLKPGATVTELVFMLRAKDDATGATMATRIISFTGVGGGAALSLPVSIPLPSETPFETLPPKRTFDDFNGGGSIADAGVSVGLGFSLMTGVVHPRTNPAELDLGGAQLGLGIGFELVGGKWTLVGGCF